MAKENIVGEAAKRAVGAHDVAGSGAKDLVKAVVWNRLLGGGRGGGSKRKSSADFYNEERLHKKKTKATTKSRKDVITHQTNERIRLAREIAADRDARAESKKATNSKNKQLKTLDKSNERRRGGAAPSSKPAAKPAPKPAAKSASKPAAKPAATSTPKPTAKTAPKPAAKAPVAKAPVAKSTPKK